MTEPFLDIDTQKNRPLTIALALKFCEKMLVSIINNAASYQQAFSEVAQEISVNDLNNNISLSERHFIFNR